MVERASKESVKTAKSLPPAACRARLARMRSRQIRGRAAVLLLAAIAADAVAGRISPQIAPRSRFTGGEAWVEVSVFNAGDETARDVQAVAELGGRSARSALREALPPGESCELRVDLGSPPTPRGLYTIVLRVHYEDDLGHGFTALSTIPIFTADTEPDPGFAVRLSPLTMEARGRIRLAVAASDPRVRDVTARLVLPAELRAAQTQAPEALAPGDTELETTVIENVSGLEGSYYRVYAVADAVVEGVHKSAVGASTIVLAPPTAMSRTVKIAWIAAGAALLAAFGLLQLLPAKPKGG